MTANKRHEAIIKQLKTNGGIIKVNDVAKKFNVSNETARRDLEYLNDQGLLERVYGGAILSRNAVNPFISSKKISGVDKKNAIAKAAAELVHDGESVMIGTGSTMLMFARQLKHLKELTVITDSLHVALELLDTPFTVIILGGQINPNELDIWGPLTIQTAGLFHVNKAFLGASGVTIKDGITDLSPGNVGRDAKMAEMADQVILLAQSDKFGKSTLTVEMPLSSVDVVITDEGLSDEYRDAVSKISELVIVPVNEERINESEESV